MTIGQHNLKRIFDIFSALCAILILFLPGCCIAFFLKVVSGGPVFFTQERIGRFGKPFRCIKFRTMRINSEADGTVTTAQDNRITASGRVLRKCKLDELPQLWNVLTGKMSFVGPRPDVAGYADALTGDDRRVLDLRPGITGPATLFFRYEEELLSSVPDPVEFNDTIVWPFKVRLNLHYYNSWGFWKDIGYILITVVPFLNGVFSLVPVSPRNLNEFNSIANRI
jgi:lipopolysaccharide/colanic/teichoic acid biosynthesis glycosyltransferase